MRSNYFQSTCVLKPFLAVQLLLLLFQPLSAQSGIHSKLLPIINDPLLAKAQFGISVRNAVSGAVLYEWNGNKSFTPASNLKLFTTSEALLLLGPDYTFKTPLLYTGEVINGVFNGTLKITGSGDPTLGSGLQTPGNSGYAEMIRIWVTKLKEMGITSFSGKLILDPLVFEYNSIPTDYTWGDIGNYYGAGSYGINLNDNQYFLTLKPGINVGDPTEILSLEPWDSSWTFNNHIVTGTASSGDKSVIYSSPYASEVFAEGSVPMGKPYTVKGSLPDPAMLLGNMLIEEIKKQGIAWKGTCEVLKQGEEFQTNGNWKTLYVEQSVRLSSIVKLTNTTSNNVYAECLLKACGSSKGLKPSGTASAVTYLKKYVQSIGIDTAGMVIRDGSGMSPFNSISPNQLTALLSNMQDKGAFVRSIPVAGKEGTVAHICIGTNDQIRLKSGTMNGTTCYSGYVKANSGITYCVSFMVNKHEAKNRIIQKLLEKGILILLND